jgi:hypothetical protein
VAHAQGNRGAVFNADCQTRAADGTFFYASLCILIVPLVVLFSIVNWGARTVHEHARARKRT